MPSRRSFLKSASALTATGLLLAAPPDREARIAIDGAAKGIPISPRL